MNYVNVLGESIRTRRLAAGMTPQALADRVGVSRQAVMGWESGDTENVKLKNLFALCSVFRVGPTELVTGSERVGESFSDEGTLPDTAKILFELRDTLQKAPEGAHSGIAQIVAVFLQEKVDDVANSLAKFIADTLPKR